MPLQKNTLNQKFLKKLRIEIDFKKRQEEVKGELVKLRKEIGKDKSISEMKTKFINTDR